MGPTGVIETMISRRTLRLKKRRMKKKFLQGLASSTTAIVILTLTLLTKEKTQTSRANRLLTPRVTRPCRPTRL